MLGVGYSLSQNLMKRTCNPNANTFIQDRQRIVFATRTIRSGEKVSVHLKILQPDGVT
mgnify:CR=1 FL=1